MKVGNGKQWSIEATKKLYIKNLKADGMSVVAYTDTTMTKTKQSNAKILFDAEDVVLKNSTFTGEFYNGFEQVGSAKHPIKKMVVDGVSIAKEAKHNLISVYNIADNAEITISNIDADLNADTSNLVRFSNYKNAQNVTVVFKNINWTYENVAASDYTWSGIVFFQGAGSDEAITNADKIRTWKFVFENCKYNGELVTENNFGTHSQVIYTYNVEGNKAAEDGTKYFDIEFK